MAKRKSEIDMKLLIFAIQRTTQFEQLIGTRFLGRTLPRPKDVCKFIISYFDLVNRTNRREKLEQYYFNYFETNSRQRRRPGSHSMGLYLNVSNHISIST
jgi:hypothetical protein